MLRKDIKKIIDFQTRFYGRGYKYDCRIVGDGKYKHIQSITDLKKKAEEGDEIRIDVLKGHKKGWSQGYEVDSIRFTIDEENKRIAEEKMNSKAKRNILFDPPQDSQKSKLYAWERETVDNFKTDKCSSIEEAQNFVNEIFEEYDLSAPNVKYSSKRSRTCSYFSLIHEIRIAEWGFSKPVLIHESAHGVVKQLGLDKYVSSHGPLFLGIYIELLDQFLDYCDKEELQMKASHSYDLDFIEDVDFDYWKYLKKNDRKVDISDINHIRQKNYVSKYGIEVTDSQKEVIKNIARGNQSDIDGRSVNALIRKGILNENGQGYEFTEKGKDAPEVLFF